MRRAHGGAKACRGRRGGEVAARVPGRSVAGFVSGDGLLVLFQLVIAYDRRPAAF